MVVKRRPQVQGKVVVNGRGKDGRWRGVGLMLGRKRVKSPGLEELGAEQILRAMSADRKRGSSWDGEGAGGRPRGDRLKGLEKSDADQFLAWPSSKPCCTPLGRASTAQNRVRPVEGTRAHAQSGGHCHVRRSRGLWLQPANSGVRERRGRGGWSGGNQRRQWKRAGASPWPPPRRVPAACGDPSPGLRPARAALLPRPGAGGGRRALSLSAAQPRRLLHPQAPGTAVTPPGWRSWTSSTASSPRV